MLVYKRVPIPSSTCGKQRMKVHRWIGLHDDTWCHRTAIILPGQSLCALVVSLGVSNWKSCICRRMWWIMILFKDMQSFRDFIHWQNMLEPGGLHLLVRRLCLNTNWAARRWLSWLSWLRRSGEDGMIHFYKWMPYLWEQNTKSRMVCQLIRMIFSMFGWEKMKVHWFKVPFFPHWKKWTTEFVSALQGLGRHRWSRADHELGVQRFLQDRSDMCQPMR